MQFQERFFKEHKYYKVIGLLLRKGEKVQMNLYGRCMRPIIKNGDNVIIQPVKPEKLKIGDIIVYQSDKRFKIHRFLKFKNITGINYMITKGDRCFSTDPPVPFSMFLGKITCVKKNNKTIYFEKVKWQKTNYYLGKLSPLLSKAEFSLKHLILFSRICVNKTFRLLFGINYRAYMAKRNKQY